MLPIPKAADSNSPEVVELCRTISPKSKPVYVSVEPMSGAIVNECYGNVEQMIKSNGGAAQYGWQVWETLPGILLEAQFHAVWVDSKGVFHDVTPKEFSEMDRILFLPDPKKKFTGQQVDSIRVALKDDPLIDESIRSEEHYFKLTNEGDLSNQFGPILTTPEIEQAHTKKVMATVAIIQKYFLKG